MVKVDLMGRLGNQMFQYAFAYATAKKNKTSFLITPTAPFEPARFFKLDPFTNFFYKHIPYSRYFIKIYSLLIPKRYYRKKVIENQSGSVDQNGKNSYVGYFQSEKYFKDYLPQIEKNFSIQDKWKKPFYEKYGEVLKNHKIIVIHVRRTDYIDFEKEHLGEKNLALPISYYYNCLNKISDIKAYKIFCISDDIPFVKENLKIDGSVSFESNNMITDFQLLQHADIAIIANSTFAWWAAYLNKKAEKIFVPKYWLGFKVNIEFPKGIIAEKFTAVDVY